MLVYKGSLVKFLSLNCCVFILLILASGCSNTDELEYITSSQPEKLAQLQGETLALLTFDYDERLLLSGETLSLDAAKSAQSYHQEVLSKELSDLFTIIDARDNELVQKANTDLLSEPAVIQSILAEVNAAGGILVKSAYGYETTSVTDADTTHAHLYNFVSTTYIVNSDGEIVWNFYGKASDVPNVYDRPLSEIGDSVLDGAIGREPDEQDTLEFIAPIIDQYIPYNYWLIKSEINGTKTINYFVDYPEYSKESGVSVYYALDESRFPSVQDDPNSPVEPTSLIEDAFNKGADFYTELFNSAKDSSWRQWGQWATAWEAIKLMVVSVGVIFICNRIVVKGDDDNFFKPLFGLIGLITLGGFLLSVWYLLRAIF